jgi:hypothetical protein
MLVGYLCSSKPDSDQGLDLGRDALIPADIISDPSTSLPSRRDGRPGLHHLPRPHSPCTYRAGRVKLKGRKQP